MFKKGQKVWLDGRNLHIPYPTRKLAPKREGPFKVKTVLSPLTYRLDLPRHWRIHDVFHASLLSPYHENEQHGPNYSKPPPDLVEGNEEHEIEAIVNHKMRRGRMHYLVKWKGFPSSENEWMTPAQLRHSANLLQEYKAGKTIVS